MYDVNWYSSVGSVELAPLNRPCDCSCWNATRQCGVARCVTHQVKSQMWDFSHFLIKMQCILFIFLSLQAIHRLYSSFFFALCVIRLYFLQSFTIDTGALTQSKFCISFVLPCPRGPFVILIGDVQKWVFLCFCFLFMFVSVPSVVFRCCPVTWARACKYGAMTASTGAQDSQASWGGGIV